MKSRSFKKLPFVPAALLLVLAACAGDNPEPGRRPPPQPNRPGVLVVGIDGASWDVVDQVERMGFSLPAFRRLQTEGSWAKLETIIPTISPAIWTTIATGVPPDRHGITGFTVRRMVQFSPGAAKPGAAATRGKRVRSPIVRSSDRKVPAIWNVASAGGTRCGVYGWWATHPPEAICGEMISGRCLFDGDPGGAHPPGLDRTVRSLAGDLQPLPITSRASDEEKRTIARYSRRDRLAARLAIRALANPESRLVMVYLRGVDPACHRFWRYFHPEGGGPSSPALGEVIPRYYQFTDRLLQQLLAARHGRRVIVVSDHGMHGVAGSARFIDPGKLLGRMGAVAKDCHCEGDYTRYDSHVTVTCSRASEARRLSTRLRRIADSAGKPLFSQLVVTGLKIRTAVFPSHGPKTLLCLEGREVPLGSLTSPIPKGLSSADHGDAPPGMFALMGTGVRAGRQLDGVSVYDITPTLLRLSGLPLAQDMPGRFLAEAFSQPPSDTGHVTSYGDRSVRAGAPTPDKDAREIQELRSLGYAL